MTEYIKVQTKIKGPGIYLLLESQWTETESDVMNVESITTLLMNAQIQSQITQMVIDGYESDRYALQLITTDAEIYYNTAIWTGLIKEQDYLNL